MCIQWNLSILYLNLNDRRCIRNLCKFVLCFYLEDKKLFANPSFNQLFRNVEKDGNNERELKRIEYYDSMAYLVL